MTVHEVGLGPSGPSERDSLAPGGPSERDSLGPSGPSERDSLGPSGPSERGSLGPSGPSERDALWQDVCGLDTLTPERGAAALVQGRAVALFRLEDDEVLAIDDVDPFWGVSVLSRGLVGCLDGRDTVASPLLKQRFDLRTGVCIDDIAVSVPVWPVRVHLGRVEVAKVPSSAVP